MQEDSLIYLHALRSLQGIGDKTLRKLLLQADPKTIWKDGIPKQEGFSAKFLDTFSRRTQFIPEPHELYQKLLDQNITIVTENNPLYPETLLEIPDHPYLLYVRGSFDFSRSKPMLAVVGTRKCTQYGRQVVESLVHDLSKAGVVIVSGLAFGIDALAHKAALDAGGETLAVLGGGVDDRGIAPANHRALAKEILAHGALISEYPPGTVIQPGNFPMRNRIIAGLTLGVLVIEGEEKSGSLITAKLALDYDREVFAIPGSIFSPSSRGTNKLIKEGAKITTCLEDILEELQIASKTLFLGGKETPDLSPTEQKIYNLLAHEPLYVDELVHRTEISASEVNTCLTILEIRGFITDMGNRQYRAL